MTKKVQEKILEVDVLVEIIEKLRKQGNKIVYCHGCFDLMHIGHIKYFQAAKQMGDLLVVTLTPDKYVKRGPGRPVFNEHLRAEAIAALDCVDYVAINCWPTAVNTIKLFKPDLYVKGADFGDVKKDSTGRLGEEEKAISSVGGNLVFTQAEVFSSSKLLKDYFHVLPKELETFLSDFKNRFNMGEVVKAIEMIKNVRVLVVGEPIIDEYNFCQLLQRASKATTISTRLLSSELYAGGALGIVNNLAGYSDKVGLLGLLGKENSREDFIKRSLKSNVKLYPFFREDGPTVIKTRYLEGVFMQKMFEVCNFNDHPITPDMEEKAIKLLKTLFPKYDMIIAADFGHGFLTKKIIDLLCTEATYLVVMAQSNSANFGYNLITKYSRADYIVIDKDELRLACHNQHGDLQPLVKKLAAQLKCPRINITLGHNGALYYKNGKFCHVPVVSWKVVDTIGAGDAVLAITSPLSYLGISPEIVGFVGNCVGALKVQYLCNKETVESADLTTLIQTLLK